jgi:hypothetical protein
LIQPLWRKDFIDIAPDVFPVEYIKNKFKQSTNSINGDNTVGTINEGGIIIVKSATGTGKTTIIPSLFMTATEPYVNKIREPLFIKKYEEYYKTHELNYFKASGKDTIDIDTTSDDVSDTIDTTSGTTTDNVSSTTTTTTIDTTSSKNVDATDNNGAGVGIDVIDIDSVLDTKQVRIAMKRSLEDAIQLTITEIVKLNKVIEEINVNISSINNELSAEQDLLGRLTEQQEQQEQQELIDAYNQSLIEENIKLLENNDNLKKLKKRLKEYLTELGAYSDVVSDTVLVPCLLYTSPSPRD